MKILLIFQSSCIFNEFFCQKTALNSYMYSSAGVLTVNTGHVPTKEWQTFNVSRATYGFRFPMLLSKLPWKWYILFNRRKVPVIIAVAESFPWCCHFLVLHSTKYVFPKNQIQTLPYNTHPALNEKRTLRSLPIGENHKQHFKLRKLQGSEVRERESYFHLKHLKSAAIGKTLD